MRLMFGSATAANPNMRNWNVSNVTNMQDMLSGANLSTDNLDGCYTNWSQLTLQQNVSFNAGGTKFSQQAQAGRNVLVNTYNWTITDGGKQFLLDNFFGALVAYSLRSLSSSTTNVIKARRSSDNAELNFTALEITDGTLTTWTGTNDGFVTTIYDQIGSNDLTQTIASRQGKIVIGGTLQTENGKPIILKGTDTGSGYISSFAPNDGVTQKGFFYVGENGGSFRSIIIGSNTDGTDFLYAAQNNSTTTLVSNNVTSSNEKINGSTWISSDRNTRGDIYDSTLNQNLISSNLSFSFDNNTLALGYRVSDPTSFDMFSFQEMVIFGNTSDTVEKENNVNDFYSIY
jgi:hypothetical protein